MPKLKNPKVSILISNYNKDLYLKKSLTSCVLQSYKNKEIIIYDDCSTDNSVKIIKKFKKVKKIYNVKRSSKSNPINQINALRNCFKHSTGDIIFFLDSDDYFKKNKLSYIVRKFVKNYKLQFIQDTPIFSNKKKIYIYQKKLSFYSIWPRFYPTSTIVCKRKFLENFLKTANLNSFPNLEIDARISIFAYLKDEFKVIASKFTYYIDNENSISSNYKLFSNNWWKKRMEAYKFMNLLANKLNIPFRKGPGYFVTKIISLILIFSK